MAEEKTKQIVMKCIADKLREVKFLIDNPGGYWEKERPGFFTGYEDECGHQLETLESQIHAGLEIAEALGYIKDSGKRFNKIWDRNFMRLKRFENETDGWWGGDGTYCRRYAKSPN